MRFRAWGFRGLGFSVWGLLVTLPWVQGSGSRVYVETRLDVRGFESVSSRKQNSNE